MNPLLSFSRSFLAMILLGMAMTACSSDRIGERDAALKRMGDNMESRQDARDKRYEAAWDRIMN